ncbi:DUF6166 domain-containing protein [Pseudomonadota bacterium]
MSIYTGKRVGEVITVTVDGTVLEPRLDLRVLSEDGFEWGYVGSGPYQLALAILAHQMGDETALGNYRSYCENVIARLGEDTWVIRGDQVTAAMEGVIEVSMTLQELLDKARSWPPQDN